MWKNIIYALLIILIAILVKWIWNKVKQLLSRHHNKADRQSPGSPVLADNIDAPSEEFTDIIGDYNEYDEGETRSYLTSIENDSDFIESYRARYLLTKNELYNYKLLKPIANAKGYVICPKVRLLDIIEPIRGQKKYKTLFYKIQAKHVDFVICDQGMHIKAIIELDDSSHDRQDRQERDRFVNLILTSVGYKVIHTRQITENIFENI